MFAVTGRFLLDGYRVRDGAVVGNMLFRYEVESHERDDEGTVLRTHGTHKHVGGISEALARRLQERGADKAQIDPFIEGEDCA